MDSDDAGQGKENNAGVALPKTSAMFGNLTQAEIEEVLEHQVYGRIACHADGLTYIVPVSYSYDGKYVYVHTWEGMKIDMMRKNPDVCFEATIMKDMANWRSVIAWGKYEELTDPVERNAALQHLVNRVLPMISSETTHLSPQWPFPPDDLGQIRGVLFRIHLIRKTGRFERHTDPASYAR